jgi:hypothetical protein
MVSLHQLLPYYLLQLLFSLFISFHLQLFPHFLPVSFQFFSFSPTSTNYSSLSSHLFFTEFPLFPLIILSFPHFSNIPACPLPISILFIHFLRTPTMPPFLPHYLLVYFVISPLIPPIPHIYSYSFIFSFLLIFLDFITSSSNHILHIT